MVNGVLRLPALARTTPFLNGPNGCRVLVGLSSVLDLELSFYAFLFCIN